MTAVLQVSFQEQPNGLIKVRADIQAQSEPPALMKCGRHWIWQTHWKVYFIHAG